MRALEPVLLLDGDYQSYLRYVGDADDALASLVEALPDEMRFVKHPDSRRLVLRNLLLRTQPFNQDGFQPSVEGRAADLDAFAAFAKQNRAQIENVLGMAVRPDIPKKPMTQLNNVLKLTGLRTAKSSITKEGAQKVYLYKLDPDRLALMTKIVADRQARKPSDAIYRIYGWDPADDPADNDTGPPRENGND